MHNRRPTALVLVLDAVGIPTLEHLLGTNRYVPHLPNLANIGLGSLLSTEFHRIVPQGDSAHFAAAVNQASASADSVIGHREMFGIIDPRTYELFPNGFPADYIAALERRIGRPTIFNRQAGGVSAIERNWQAHEVWGAPIVYASKCDPLLQIAMSEQVISLEEQVRIGEEAFALAREMGVPLTRVITRPYVREGITITRTENRHDLCLPLEPGQHTLVDLLSRHGVRTIAVGKTADLVPAQYDRIIKIGRGRELPAGFEFVSAERKDMNPYSLQGTVEALELVHDDDRGAIIVTNLVDTDSLWGHTRQVVPALQSLEKTDRAIGQTLLPRMHPGDYLFVSADHGMEHRSDYGYHSIEPLPLLAYRVGKRGLEPGVASGCLGNTLADVGYMIAQLFGVRAEFVRTCGLERFYGASLP